MFDHVTIRATDREASERFYDLVLPAIAELEYASRGTHFTEWNEFSLARADGDHPPTRRLHVGFAAPSRERVDEFWRVGTGAGYRDDGAPGLREYAPDYYGAFLLDPDGNSAEAVHSAGLRGKPGRVDHLWIRVADLEAATRFYESLASHTGFELHRRRPDRTQFAGSEASFSVVADDPPTRHVHVAFPATDDAAVDAFHAAATAAGHPDNGAPGERPEYHRGYYGAFVLDPDGNNVEVVCHNR